MKNIYTKEKVIKYKTEILEINKDLALIVDRQNSRVTQETLVERKSLKFNRKKNTYDLKQDFKWGEWGYYKPEIFDEFKKKHFTQINYHKFKIKVLKELQAGNNINKRNILRFDASSHLVYRLGQEAPVSGIYVFDYIGGVDNKDFHIEKAYKHLKKLKSVLSVKKETIPYYNSSRYRTEGLMMEVLLPQTKINELWEEVKIDPYPSCRLKDNIIPKHWTNPKIDPLGLRKFLRSKEELAVIEEWDD